MKKYHVCAQAHSLISLHSGARDADMLRILILLSSLVVGH